MGSLTETGGTGRRRPARRLAIATVAVLATSGAVLPQALAAPAGPATARPAPAASSVTWRKISTNTGLGIASAGLLRTRDGRLHVVWPRKDGITYSLHYSTLGAHAKVLATGTILSKWAGVSAYPRLVPGPRGGIRLVFTGGNGKNGSPFNLSAMYTATASAAGQKWALVNGSMSHSTLVPLTDTAAATESNGTPVAAWPAGVTVDYHVGVDPHIPASAPDSTVTIHPGFATRGEVLARDRNGSIWAAWYTFSNGSDRGYWADRILPTKQAKIKAPGSGSPKLADNEPFGTVGFAARVGGGAYLAYCVPTKLTECAHLNLWRAGAARAHTVPGSGTGRAMFATVAAAPRGHLWVLWYDAGKNKIRIVRTNRAATRFGPVQTIPAPPKVIQFDGLQAEGSGGPLNVIALDQQSTPGATPAYWATQLLPRLHLTGSPAKVSHLQATKVTFRVSDVGDPIAGATVHFLGKTAKTNSFGKVTFTVPRGTSQGKHTARASKPGYTPATFTIRVT